LLGNVTIVIRRLDPDLTLISLTGLPALGSGINPMNLELSPPYNATRGPATYRNTVTYQFGQIILTPTFSVGNSTTIDNGQTATGANVDSNTASNVFNLNVGNNTFHVCSRADGQSIGSARIQHAGFRFFCSFVVHFLLPAAPHR
jgi:hypothetical protein